MISPPDIALLKRTFTIDIDYTWLQSPNRNRLVKFLSAHGASEVRRVGSSKQQQMYITWINDKRTNEELMALIQGAIETAFAT